MGNAESGGGGCDGGNSTTLACNEKATVDINYSPFSGGVKVEYVKDDCGSKNCSKSASYQPPKTS